MQGNGVSVTMHFVSEGGKNAAEKCDQKEK